MRGPRTSKSLISCRRGEGRGEVEPPIAADKQAYLREWRDMNGRLRFIAPALHRKVTG